MSEAEEHALNLTLAMPGFRNTTALSETMQDMWRRLEGCWSGTKIGGYSVEDNSTTVCCQDGREGAEEDVLLAILRDARTGVPALVLGSDATMYSAATWHDQIKSLESGRLVRPIMSLAPRAADPSMVSLDTAGSIIPRGGGSTGVILGCWMARVGAGGSSLEVETLRTPGILSYGSADGFVDENCPVTPFAEQPAEAAACAWPTCWEVEERLPGLALGHTSARLRLALTRAPWGRCTGEVAAPDEAVQEEVVRDSWGLTAVALAAAGGVAALCVVAAGLVCWTRRRRRLRAKDTAKEGPGSDAAATAGEAEEGASSAATTSAAALESSALFAQGNLVDVISRGIAEHWVVPPSDLEFVVAPSMQGGFGDVRRARLMRSSDVAIKICKGLDGPEGAKASAAVMLKNEIRIFRRVRHPNIVLFYGVTVLQGGALGVVLEWVGGGDLLVFVKRRRKDKEHQADWDACRAQGVPLPEWKLVQDVARGLAFLHSQTPPILHRDLKPQNVLVQATRPPKAKLTDFGLSVLMPEGREVNARAGTTNYMAPEVQSRSAYGIAADVYSLGCLMVFSASGRSPPVGRALQAAQELQAAEEHVPAAAAFAVLALDCLQTDPDARPLVSEAFARLGDIVDAEATGRSSP